MSLASRKIFFALLLILVVSGSVARGASAQAKHEANLKTVRGVVLDKSEAPIAAAVVFLKNVHSNQVKSYIADPQGNYRFSGLDPNADYELHAEKDGTKSQTRNVSSFDTRLDIVLNLKLERKKS